MPGPSSSHAVDPATGAPVWPPPAGTLTHQPDCFGCGPGNPSALGVVLRRDAGDVVGEATLGPGHAGAPGIVHGGAVSALFDEVLGSVSLANGRLVVTAELTVRFVAPARVGRLLELRAREVSHAGRKTLVRGELRDGEAVVATGEALFITVDAAHFAVGGEG